MNQTSDVTPGEKQKTRLSYTQQLKNYIEQNKFYPRLALRLNQVGVVRIRLEITPNGIFKNVKIIHASAHKSLNTAALKLIKDLKHFKPLPKSFQKDTGFIIPLAYEITGVSH